MLKPASILIASALLAAPAVAETPMETQTFAFKFNFDRADLASAQGAERVYRQLQIAVADACRFDPESAVRGVDRDCRARLLRESVDRIGDQQLASVSRKLGIAGAR